MSSDPRSASSTELALAAFEQTIAAQDTTLARAFSTLRSFDGHALDVPEDFVAELDAVTRPRLSLPNLGAMRL